MLLRATVAPRTRKPRVSLTCTLALTGCVVLRTLSGFTETTSTSCAGERTLVTGIETAPSERRNAPAGAVPVAGGSLAAGAGDVGALPVGVVVVVVVVVGIGSDGTVGWVTGSDGVVVGSPSAAAL
jgi:hypothetical protein